MFATRHSLCMAMMALTCFVGVAQGEVISSGPDHYTLKQEAESPLPLDELWERLIEPAKWWHPDHTYSGDANNLVLDLEPGGTWSEAWDENFVVHGRIMLVKNKEELRLDAPFGPLQERAVTVVWTISLMETEVGGTYVRFEERASGSQTSDLDALAPAVDYVKSEAIQRLVDPAVGPEDR